MATSVKTILAKVRDNLSDTEKTRWTDERLIGLIDEGQKDLANKAGNLKDIIILDLVKGEYYYSLPENVLIVTRVEYKKAALKPITTSQINRDANVKGSPEYFVFDKLRRPNITLYPIPDKDENGVLAVYCNTLPRTLTNGSDEIEISSAYVKALEFYATYRALMDNQDTMSIQLASQYNSLYQVERRQLKKDSIIDFTDVGNYTRYKGFI